MGTTAEIIDDWKLPIFKRYLDMAGYTFRIYFGNINHKVLLHVQHECVSDLKAIIEAANRECENVSKQGNT